MCFCLATIPCPGTDPPAPNGLVPLGEGISRHTGVCWLLNHAYAIACRWTKQNANEPSWLMAELFCLSSLRQRADPPCAGSHRESGRPSFLRFELEGGYSTPRLRSTEPFWRGRCLRVEDLKDESVFWRWTHSIASAIRCRLGKCLTSIACRVKRQSTSNWFQEDVSLKSSFHSRGVLAFAGCGHSKDVDACLTFAWDAWCSLFQV